MINIKQIFKLNKKHFSKNKCVSTQDVKLYLSSVRLDNRVFFRAPGPRNNGFECFTVF